MNGGIKERKRDEQRQLQLIYDRALIHVFFGKISSKTYLCIFFLRLLFNVSKHSGTSVKINRLIYFYSLLR